MIDLIQTTKDGKTFFELVVDGSQTGRGSFDEHSARLICKNERNKQERALMAQRMTTLNGGETIIERMSMDGIEYN